MSHTGSTCLTRGTHALGPEVEVLERLLALDERAERQALARVGQDAEQVLHLPQVPAARCNTRNRSVVFYHTST